ncbi:hypothetical protein DU475_17730 [Rhodopseudomonas sp. WA056]|nr:hypothetical protein [Rhodopseudomonas sp. WA056]
MKSRRLRFSGAFFFGEMVVGSGEAGSQSGGADEIDGAQDIVGEDAEGGFVADLLAAPGEESSPSVPLFAARLACRRRATSSAAVSCYRRSD